MKQHKFYGCDDLYFEFILEQQRKGAVPTVPSLQSVIDSTFKREARQFENSGGRFEYGQAVLAKMSGYAPWPARIEGFTKNGRRVKCFFYGSHNTGTVDINQVIPFKNAFSIIRLINLRNTRDFAKGVKEIEMQCGVPDELSALKEMNAIV